VGDILQDVGLKPGLFFDVLRGFATLLTSLVAVGSFQGSMVLMEGYSQRHVTSSDDRALVMFRIGTHHDHLRGQGTYMFSTS
jgi:hypothetical protein